MRDVENAKKLLLSSSEHTCVFCRENQVYTSNYRGVYALARYLFYGVALSGFSAADRVVGRAAALLFVMADIKEVYAQVISKPALSIFSYYGLDCSYGEIVPEILDLAQTGLSPLEASIARIKDPEEACRMLKQIINGKFQFVIVQWYEVK